MTYFNIYFEESTLLGTARSRSDDLVFLPERGPVTSWASITLDLVDGEYPDYLASDLGLRVCSARMRRVLEEVAAPADKLEWLAVEVMGRGEVRPYWVLHFPEPVDALGSRTIRKGDFVVRPVLSLARLAGHAVLTYPGSEGISLVVDEVGRAALERAGCSGFECVPAAVEP